MRHHLAIDPVLDLAAEKLVAAWSVGEYATQTEASVEPTTASAFPIGEITVLATIISNCRKQKFSGSKPPVVEVTTITTPDVEPLFIIRKSIERQEP
ncbi:MAG: hypothetical protein HGB15_09615 [Chlorobaculum sp.]|nr:hypothetical protein [Chlorobaculum sp.]